MRALPAVPLLAIFLAACPPASRTPPGTGERQQTPPPQTASADTGTRAVLPTGAVVSPDDGQEVTILARWPGPPPAETQEALLDGTLVAQKGCLWVVPQSGPRYAVIWPEQVELASGAGPVRIRDRQTGVAVRVGGRIRVGGGEVPAGAVSASLPRVCQGPLWLATSIVS